MIKINKDITKFLALPLLLSIILITALQKLFPSGVRHAISYCQFFVNSFSVEIPHIFIYLPVIILSIITLFSITKFIFILYRTLRFRQRVIANQKFNKELNLLLKELNLQDKGYVVKGGKPFAFCLGIINPKIYISTKMLSLMNKNELAAVLIHEKYHLEHRDTFIMLILSIAKSLFPFFPAFSDFSRNYHIEQEIKADHKALKSLGDKRPILSVMKKLLKYPNIAIDFAPAVFDNDTLEPRIKALINKDFKFKKFGRINLAVSILFVFAMFLAFLTPVRAIELHDQKQEIVMICTDNNHKEKPHLQKESDISNASRIFTP